MSCRINSSSARIIYGGDWKAVQFITPITGVTDLVIKLQTSVMIYGPLIDTLETEVFEN